MAMSTVMLRALTACATVTLAAAREQIKPSLECACRSSQSAEDRFDLNCQNIGSGELTRSGGAQHPTLNVQSLLSCAQGPAGGNGDWLLAEIPGWGVYRLSTRTLSWKDAAAACEAVREQQVALDGGEAELKALLRAFAHVVNDRKELLWVGIRYLEAEKEFYTVRGQKMSQLPWAQNQPSIRKGENCVKLQTTGKIHSTHACHNKRRFFCKG